MATSTAPAAASIKIVFWIAAVWAFFLSAAHYFDQRPLWHDEARVFYNIQHRTPGQILTQPLKEAQEFPRLYLVAIQKFAGLFDNSLLALRFFPFVFMMAALGLWLHLARQGLPSDRARVLFALSWAASIPLIYYAAELKQYSMDVLAGALFLVFVRRQAHLSQDRPAAHMVLLMLLPCCGLFSYMAFLMFIFPLLNLLRLKADKRQLWLYAFSCAAVAFTVYWCDVRINNGPALREYWKEYFISFNSAGDFFRTFFEGVNNLISRWFAEDPKWVRMAARVFMAFGLWQMFAGFRAQLRRDSGLFCSPATVALIVFLELFILGCLQLYAFSVPRTSLFFCPMLFFLAAQAMRPWFVQAVFALYLIYITSGIAMVIGSGDLGAQSPLWKPFS